MCLCPVVAGFFPERQMRDQPATRQHSRYSGSLFGTALPRSDGSPACPAADRAGCKLVRSITFGEESRACTTEAYTRWRTTQLRCASDVRQWFEQLRTYILGLHIMHQEPFSSSTMPGDQFYARLTDPQFLRKKGDHLGIGGTIDWWCRNP